MPLERADITPDPDNARLHTPRNIGVIEDSMQRDGAGRSILVDQDGVTIAGAGAWEAATHAGVARVAIIETDGDTLVVVKRTVTPEQRLRLALADVLARVVAEPLHGLTDADAVPPEWSTPIQRGDLFALGAHRLLCGDSTDTADVSRVLDGRRPLLMVTDPRYGVDYDPAWRAGAGVNENTRKLCRVTNDDRADWTEA